jgi:3-(3-hydroxy-phenyl)propionate hydroxylase
LRRRLDEIDTVTVRYGCECVAFDAADDSVAVSLRDAASGAATQVRVRWLVGCDGASSFVRDRLGGGVDDLGFDEPWVVIDTKLKRDIGLPDDTAYQFCDPARPTTCVPAGPGRRRWEFMLLPGESPEAIKAPASVWRLLARWGDERSLEVVRVAVYRFHALLARQWRRGRVLLAGDAAHQMPPFMGQGMCSGIRDAANLAWKLGLVLRGTAPPSLLESYQAERAPHVRRIVETSVAMGRIVCEQDPARAAERDAFMIASRQQGGDTLGRGQGGQAALLEGGSLVTTTPGAGRLFPQPTGMLDGRAGRLDDLVGSGAQLVVAGAAAPAGADVRVVELNTDGSDAFVETGGPSAAAWLKQHGALAALVRPDHYVFGTAATAAAASELVRAFERAVTTH